MARRLHENFAMAEQNSLLTLKKYGQSIWLDLLSRELIRSGKLKGLIDTDGVTGVTSNPAIFEKAIDESTTYDGDIRRFFEEGRKVTEVYEALVVEDIREAAQVLAPIYRQTSGLDGYVSLEVSPLVAHDTQATIVEARRLWAAVDRPNAMIKIPGTREGLPAIAQCVGEGININVTLIFGLERYREVAEAYLRGLEQLAARGEPLRNVRSVASFFLSRIDVLVDKLLAENRERTEEARALEGRAAVASARLAYQIYREIFGSERFLQLEKKHGARRQWLLWASTGRKNKAYSDVKYVDEIVGSETVNTMPVETIEAYRDHGNPAPRLEQNPDSERQVFPKLAELSIDIRQVTQQLEDEGVKKFADSFASLKQHLDEKAHLAHAR